MKMAIIAKDTYHHLAILSFIDSIEVGARHVELLN